MLVLALAVNDDKIYLTGWKNNVFTKSSIDGKWQGRPDPVTNFESVDPKSDFNDSSGKITTEHNSRIVFRVLVVIVLSFVTAKS